MLNGAKKIRISCVKLIILPTKRHANRLVSDRFDTGSVLRAADTKVREESGHVFPYGRYFLDGVLPLLPSHISSIQAM